ncbi:uncharacterized protein [Nicotiana tomentosiformis]|uniref:uncharacterized protein n=1 Tax=Nicotiana tomentosiformis TaxID=4098 RepID=UPI00388CA67F
MNEGRFLKLLNLNYGQYLGLGGKWVKLGFLFQLYGLECNFERNVGKLKSKEDKETWKVHRRDGPEGSNRRRNDQRAIERLKEELEHARMTISKQQAQLQAVVAQIRLNIEKDYQSTLRVMDKDLKHTKNEAARLEEEVESTIGLVRRVEANKNAKIHKLQEDLSIIEEDAHQQQLEYDQQRERFERERAYWIHSKGQFHAQLEEIKRHKRGHQHADFKAERRQWMIERAMLNRRIKEYEGRETQMENALNTTQIWL